MKSKSTVLAFGTLALWLLYYAPLCFGPTYAHITIHDNLDSAYVYNRIIGVFYRDPTAAQHLMLGGNVPLFLLQQIDWPLSLINVVRDNYVAYILNDLTVRAVGFFGMFSLGRRISGSK